MNSSHEPSPTLTPEEQQAVQKAITRRTFLSFTTLGVGVLGGFLGWKWLNDQPEVDGALAPLRAMFENNTAINETLLYSNTNLAPVFPRSAAAKEPRTNGDVGIEKEIALDEWKLTVHDPQQSRHVDFTFDQIASMPKTELTFEFKCVEGWSEVQNWGGVRLADFLRQYRFGTNYRYVGMATPDKEYYVGLDMASALHPQTLLAYESNGGEISLEQGYPLRLIIPVKYGIKNIKRIGSITLTNERPPDYWGEQGYDYYAGL
jgi:DMSO/TMAO reductase YedYZ molybdopterin-dependent catalytic subunit